jgi:hypothetical protein
MPLPGGLVSCHEPHLSTATNKHKLLDIVHVPNKLLIEAHNLTSALVCRTCIPYRQTSELQGHISVSHLPAERTLQT